MPAHVQLYLMPGKICRSGSIGTHLQYPEPVFAWTVMSKETLEAGLDLMRMNTVGSPAGSIDEQIKAPYTPPPSRLKNSSDAICMYI